MRNQREGSDMTYGEHIANTIFLNFMNDGESYNKFMRADIKSREDLFRLNARVGIHAQSVYEDELKKILEFAKQESIKQQAKETTCTHNPESL